MLRNSSPLLIAVGVAIAVLWALPAAADPARSISPFASPDFTRTIHGDVRSLELSAAGHGFGSAQAFFGVDALSNADRQYLTSGLQWRSGASDTPLLRLAVLQTEGHDTTPGAGQTLIRAEHRLDLGGRWYLPDLTTEIMQVSSGGANRPGLGGRAARVGLAQDLGAGSYEVGYFQADPQFDALGSALVAGDSGLEVESRYAVGSGWQLAHDLRLYQPTEVRGRSSLIQEWTISRTPRLTDIGRPWRFSARLGDRAVALDADHGTPIALELAAQSARWRSWRLNTSLGWYDHGMQAPLNMPVAGTLWQVSASRGLTIGGLRTEFSPRFFLGGSRYDGYALASRTGLALGFSRLSDNIDLSIDYLSPGWSRTPGADSDVQMTLNYTQSTSAFLPSLRSMVGGIRLPWQRRR